MFCSKFLQTWAIGLCVVATLAGMAYGATPNEVGIQTVPSMQNGEVNRENDLLLKQQEIDRYLFINHAAEVAQQGFMVTHTGLKDSYVEIGIRPYSEENAQYLYEIFGQDLIKVVEGPQAVRLDTPDSSAKLRIRVNGEEVAAEAAPFIENSRTLIPLRGVMEKLGAQVNWDAEAQKVEVAKAETKLVFLIGQKSVQIIHNNKGIATEETVELDVPAQIRNSYTYIPARFASENLGATVAWDETSQTVSIELRENRDYGNEMKNEVIGIRGTITEIAKDEANQVISIKVEGKVESDTSYDKAIVKITADTVVFREENGARITGNGLIQGDVVEIVFAGGVNESYPVQGSAKFIKVLQGDVPSNQDEIGPSLTEMQKGIAVDSVLKMELYNLEQEKLKTFNREEMEKIIGQLNSGQTYLGAHIMMLAGNNIKITFNDNTSAQLTSYGSQDHVILAGQIGQENVSYCIICPEVGKILLAQ